MHRSQIPLLSLQPLKKLHKSRGFLRATNLKLVVDRKIRHSMDILRIRILHLLVNLRPSLTRLKPLFRLRLIKSCLGGCLKKCCLRRDIFFIFKVGCEEGFDDAGLRLGALFLAELNQSYLWSAITNVKGKRESRTMRIPRVARPPSKAEIDTLITAKSLHALDYSCRALLAKFRNIVTSLVDALASVRVEVERIPSRGKSVV
jgi:hypothetical protein